jgi:E3 ubiquitin-protein ligase SHPRH
MSLQIGLITENVPDGIEIDPNSDSSSTTDAAMLTILDTLGLLFNNDEDNQSESPAALLYDAVSGEKPKNQILHDAVNTAKVSTRMKHYQLRAAGWMRWRELNGSDYPQQCRSTHPLWKRILHDPSVNCNIATGKLSTSEFKAPRGVSGGILADEMGIGKSLEILCLIASTLSRTQNAACERSRPTLEHAADRVDCICGARTPEALEEMAESSETISVQCDLCLAWQHESCIRWKSDKERKKVIMGSSEYICGHCASFLASAPDVSACATLIVCPSQILQQWVREIDSHIVGDISVYVYHGQDQSAGGGSSAESLITPSFLASHNIVLTTYDVLRNELAYNPSTNEDDTAGIGERNRSRSGARAYYKIPTPLTRVLPWRRVVLDEAQMVESTVAKPSAFARKLEAESKWCVTGTPMSTGLADLYGLLLFARACPFDTAKLWKKGVEKAAERGDIAPLTQFFKPLTLRRTRDDVSAELDIPPQHDITTWLRFTAVESHHYQQEAAKAANDAFQTLDRALSTSLNASTVPQVLKPLASLRQACIHPQAGSHGIASKHGEVLSLDQVHDRLIERARTNAEEAMRALCLSLNGCAGLYALMSRIDDAVGCYRSVLAVERDGKDLGLRLDKLQKLHTLVNLSDLLFRDSSRSDAPQNVTRTLRDEQLESEARDIEEEYVNEAKAKRRAAKEQLENDIRASERLKVDVEEPWFAAVLRAIPSGSKEEYELLNKISYELDGRWGSEDIPFTSAQGLLIKLSEDLKRMHEAHSNLQSTIETLDALVDQPSDGDIRRAGRCWHCSRELGIEGVTCAFCEAEPTLDAAEAVLFGRQLARADVGTGRSNPSPAEMTLRVLSQQQKQYQAHAKPHLQRLELLRKHFSHARTLWSAQRGILTARDELEMSKTRDRLREPAECPQYGELDPVPEAWRSVILFPNELTGLLTQREREAKVHRSELSNTTSQMRFLSRLKGAEDGTDSEECPICKMMHSWKEEEAAILACGHTMHAACAIDLVKKTTSSQGSCVSCPHCRSKTQLQDVSYIRAANDNGSNGSTSVATASAPASETHASSEDSTSPDYLNALLAKESEENIRGAFGTKIEAVVRRIKAILDVNEESKALVFSEWNDVLGIISHALKRNNVLHERAQGANVTAQKALRRFATRSDRRVLLLPFARGAAGLTLVNADHVVLVEPNLDPGVEQQAIKRVDRIGQQSESTCIHRFVVTRTVEERVQKVAQSRRKSEARLPDVAKSEKKALTADDVTFLVNGSTLG